MNCLTGWLGNVTAAPTLFLDTNVIRNKEFIHWVSAEYVGRMIIPSVAYMEFKRQLISNNKDLNTLELLLKKHKITVKPFEKKDADIAAELMAKRKNGLCKTCGNIDWADTMIYASIRESSSILVTENISDFPSDDRVKRPADVEKLFKVRK